MMITASTAGGSLLSFFMTLYLHGVLALAMTASTTLYQINVNSCDAARRMRVEATVRHINDDLDYVLLQTADLDLEPPIVDTGCYNNQAYILVGTSAKSQVSHGGWEHFG